MCIHRYLTLFVCALSSAATDYTAYIGDAYPYQVSALATDATGNTYVTGSRAITFPGSTTTPLNDIFVSKIDPSGNVTLLATLSGKGSDQANGLALDASGNIYLVGRTSSPNFPLHNALQTIPATGGTGFLVKLSPDGTVQYSTFLGGTKGSSGLNAVAADVQGNAYVTGTTVASDYPRTPGLPAGTVGSGIGSISGAFFAKISPAGDKILYAGALVAPNHACSGGSSCFLSSINTSGTSIAIDSAGDAYVAGNTNGAGLPATAGAFVSDGIGGFAAKVNASGAAMVYVTFLGSTRYTAGPFVTPANTAYAVAADATGNAYIAGATTDPAFPATASAFQPTLAIGTAPIDPFAGPPSDAFVAKLNPTGSAVVWGSFLGGTGADQAGTIAVDSGGNVWVSGATQSSDFPVPAGFPSGQEFVAEFNSSGTALSFGERTPANTVAAALAVDSAGALHVAGGTGLVSTITPSQTSLPHIFGIANAAGGTLAGRLSAGEVISLYGLHLGPAAPAAGSFNSAGFLPITLAGIQVTINGTPAPLLYVSSTQINAVAPVELPNDGPGSLAVAFNGSALPAFRVIADAADPEVFRRSDGTTAAVNQDGTLNSQANPAKAGSYVSIWATGAGATPGLGDGQIQTAAQPTCACVLSPLGVNQQPLIPSYAGAAPGTVNGVVQINFQAPAAANNSSFSLNVSGKASDPFSIYVAP